MMHVKKIFQTLEKKCEHKYFLMLFLPISIIFLLFYSYTTSPLFMHEGMDSAVFKTMGLAILQGKVPYLDIFDHKGPVLYFINALGQYLIPGRLGIFCLQAIGLFIVLICFFKTANLFIGKFTSFVSVLITLLVYGGVIQEGNQCEEWMMIFFSISLYYILKFFTQNSTVEHHWCYSLLYGLCFGLTFFIRPNDAIAQIGGIMFGLSIWLIYNKQYKNLFENIVSFGLGFVIVAMPIYIYFAYHNAIGDMLYGLIGFNTGYAGGVKLVLFSLFSTNKLMLSLLLVLLCVILYSENKRILYVIVPLLSFQVILLGNKVFPHYFIVLIPIVLIYIVLTFLLHDTKLKIVAISVICLSTPFGEEGQIIKKTIKETISRYTMLRDQEKIMNYYNETDKLLSHIPSKERNSVWNHNLNWINTPNFSCLFHHGIVQCNKITYAESDKLLYHDNILDKLPLWVVAENPLVNWQKENMFKSDTALIAAYECVAITDTAICNLELYRLKQ